MKKAFLWVLCILLIIISVKGPQGFVFPMWILVYLFREKLRAFLDHFPRWIAFIGSGLLFGLLTEVFAIAQNWNAPANKKVLLHPDPLIDLLFGLLYYGLFIITWYLLVRKVRFSGSQIFILSGIFGVISEQNGAIFFGSIANPIMGSLLAFLVMSVYGIFPLLAYLLTQHRFTESSPPKEWQYLLVCLSLFFFWALYGNFIYKPLLLLFPK